MPAKKKAALPGLEDSLAELEEIIARMENSQLPLEDLVTGYERGASLLKHAHAIIGGARQRIEAVQLDLDKAAPEGHTAPALADDPDPEDGQLL